jgi:hypothetical protein
MNDHDELSPGPEPVSGEILAAPPPEAVPAHFYELTDWWSFGITALLMLVVYLFTVTPEVQLNDAGVFVTAATHAGVGQPAGFPVWTIYAWLFTKLLPLSNFAWRVSVSSSAAAALACGLIALMVSRGAAMIAEGLRGFQRFEPQAEKSLRIVCGYVAGMAFGLDGCVWERAVSPDPWPLTLLLFATMLALLMRWRFAPSQKRYLYAAMFVYGLGLTNSQSLAAAAPGFGILILLEDPALGRDIFATVTLLLAAAFGLSAFGILQDQVIFAIHWDYLWRDFKYLHWIYGPLAIGAAFISIGFILKTRGIFTNWKHFFTCGILLLLGFSVVLYLPLASMTNPPMNWGYPRTVDGFWHVLSRGQYEGLYPTDIIHEPARFFMQTGLYWKIAMANFGSIYLGLAALPFFFLIRMRVREWKWIFGLLGIFLWMSLFMLIMVNQSDYHVSVECNKIFFAASHLVLAILAGYGLALCGFLLHAKRLQADSAPELLLG